MKRDVHLNVLLPHNRDHTGWIRIELDGVPQSEFRVLGRGSKTYKDPDTGKVYQNPTLSPFQFAGNTPTGDYKSTGLDSRPRKRDSYGPWGVIPLKAIAGNALLAELVGREGILIHSGGEGKFDGYRPTLGCLRLHDRDMKALIGILSGAGDNATTQMCDSIEVRISVREW